MASVSTYSSSEAIIEDTFLIITTNSITAVVQLSIRNCLKTDFTMLVVTFFRVAFFLANSLTARAKVRGLYTGPSIAGPLLILAGLATVTDIMPRTRFSMLLPGLITTQIFYQTSGKTDIVFVLEKGNAEWLESAPLTLRDEALPCLPAGNCQAKSVEVDVPIGP